MKAFGDFKETVQYDLFTSIFSSIEPAPIDNLVNIFSILFPFHRLCRAFSRCGAHVPGVYIYLGCSCKIYTVFVSGVSVQYVKFSNIYARFTRI